MWRVHIAKSQILSNAINGKFHSCQNTSVYLTPSSINDFQMQSVQAKSGAVELDTWNQFKPCFSDIQLDRTALMHKHVFDENEISH